MAKTLSRDAQTFTKANDVAVLSTSSRNGDVQGAAIYYRYIDGNFYILTKSDSSKSHNMLANHRVALTIFNSDEMKTLQLQGKAHIESDIEMKRLIFDELVNPRPYKGEHLMPPVTQLDAGGFITFRIEPTIVHYTDYKDSTRIIPSHIFPA